MNQTESEDYHREVNQDLLNAANKKIKELEKDVSRMNRQMQAQNLEEVYKDNDLLRKELKNMDILLDENNDLREEVDRMKKMSFDERYSHLGDENAGLRRRNGQLLIENTNLKEELEKVKKAAPLEVNQAMIAMGGGAMRP